MSLFLCVRKSGVQVFFCSRSPTYFTFRSTLRINAPLHLPPLTVLICSAFNPSAMLSAPFKSTAYSVKIRFTIFAESALTVILPSFTSYPRQLLPNTTPCSIFLCCPHFTRSEILRLSSCAIVAIIESLSSPSLSRVSILSFIKIIPTPFDLSIRVMLRVSTVFLAKRLTSFVRIISMPPDTAREIILLKP